VTEEDETWQKNVWAFDDFLQKRVAATSGSWLCIGRRELATNTEMLYYGSELYGEGSSRMLRWLKYVLQVIQALQVIVLIWDIGAAAVSSGEALLTDLMRCTHGAARWALMLAATVAYICDWFGLW